MKFWVLLVRYSIREGALSSAGEVPSFTLTPMDSAYLEIGQNYIVCNDGYEKLYTPKRERVEVTLHINDKACLTPEIRNRYGLSAEHIGIITFSKAFEDHFDPRPPTLDIFVYVHNQAINQINSLIKTRIIPSEVKVDVPLSCLKNGWQPDGSHLIWEIGDDEPRQFSGQKCALPIDHFSLSSVCFEQTERQAYRRSKRIRLKSSLLLMLEKVRNELRLIKVGFYIILILLGILIYGRI